MQIIFDVLPCRGHKVVVFPTLSQNDLPPMASVDFVPLTFEPTGGWPKACNEHFRAIADWAWLSEKQDGPLYLMELDSVPVRENWADLLEDEFLKSGKDFMGAVVPTRKMRNGEPFTDHKDPHMVGSGLFSQSAMGGLLPTPPDVAWDIYNRHIIMPRCHATEQIQHRWGTVNYQFNQYLDGGKGGYTCEDKPGNPPGSSHAADVDSRASVVHGAKDGSLAKLVIGGHFFR